jgi:hypothetical protein
VLVLQVVDQHAFDKLHRGIVNHFPFVVCDVGSLHWRCGRFMMASGLMVASKYPVIAAKFAAYSEPMGKHRICRGMLMVKVRASAGRWTCVRPCRAC